MSTYEQWLRAHPQVVAARVIMTIALTVATFGLVFPYGAVSAKATNALEWTGSVIALILAVALVVDLSNVLRRRADTWQPLVYMFATVVWAVQAMYLLLIPALQPHTAFDEFLKIETQVGWLWSIGNSLQALGWVILSGLIWRLLVARKRFMENAENVESAT
jgi:hypothetical protein